MTAQDRRRASFAIPLIAVLLFIAAGMVTFVSFIPMLGCPGCRAWKDPGLHCRIVHTGPCRYCDGDARVTLPGWVKARRWVSDSFDRID